MTTCSLINESYLNQMLNVDMTLLGLYMSLVPGSRGGGAVGLSVRPAIGGMDVRIPAVTDLRHKNSSTAKRSTIGVSVTSRRR